MKRFFSIVGCVAIVYTNISAQETTNDTTISRNIEVVKEYNPVIKEAGKISTMPELKDIGADEKNASYSVWTAPFSLKPSPIQSLDYATVQAEPVKKQKERYAKIAGGNYSSVFGEVYLPIYKNSNYSIDFQAVNNSTFGMIDLTKDSYKLLPKDVESDATSSDTKAKLSFSKSYRNKEFSSYVGGGYNFFKYYGFNSQMVQSANEEITSFNNDSLKQAFTNIDVNIRYRTKEFISKWKYDLQTNYQLFHNKTGLSENTIFTDLNGDYRMESSALGLNFQMYNIIMKRPDSTELYNFEEAENMRSHTVLKVTPHYTFGGEVGTIVIGVKGAFSIGQGKKGAVTPDIYGTVKVVKDKIYIYAGVTGDYVVNNYRHITQKNQYTTPDTRVEDTYIPIDVYAGTKIKIMQRINMDLYAGYKVINNPYFFVNKTYNDSSALFYNTFDVVYEENAGLFNAGLLLSYNWKEKLDLKFNATYDNWSLSEYEHAWQLPDWKLKFQSSYLATDYLRFKLGYTFEAGQYALINDESFKMPNIHNLSIGADWKVLNWLNLFVNFDNVLNQEYQSWYGYTNQGFNFMGGASVIF